MTLHYLFDRRRPGQTSQLACRSVRLNSWKHAAAVQLNYCAQRCKGTTRNLNFPCFHNSWCTFNFLTQVEKHENTMFNPASFDQNVISSIRSGICASEAGPLMAAPSEINTAIITLKRFPPWGNPRLGQHTLFQPKADHLIADVKRRKHLKEQEYGSLKRQANGRLQDDG